MTVRLIDDEGKAVTGAVVTAIGYSTEKPERTDSMGGCNFCFGILGSTLELDVQKNGFYPVSRYLVSFNSVTNSQLLPWNPIITIGLHKTNNPTALIVKNVKSDLPIFYGTIGYDLLRADWVAPFGEGVSNDVQLSVQSWTTNADNYLGILSLKFANPKDGVIRLSLPARTDFGLRLAAQAPLTGYSNQLDLIAHSYTNPVTGYRTDDWNFSEDDHYYFRIRSATNQQGEVTSALYGKIYWGIHFYVGMTNVPTENGLKSLKHSVKFLYYLNPDGTRNTEWDPNRNLCKDPGMVGARP
ncbi:MAG: hypothetical protein U1F98_12065 [Verrucomicrobiota bacterium]